MSKKKKILLGIVIAFFSLFITNKFLGYKGYLKIYTIPSTSSSPALEVGDYIFVTNLIPLNNNDFIAYKRYDERLGDLSSFVSRMVAKAGDSISIVDGVTFVNGVNIDKNINVKHSYKIHIDLFKKLTRSQTGSDYYQVTRDSVILYIEDKAVLPISRKNAKHYGVPPHKVHETFPKEWNSHNFGPLIIPENTFFVLGDNRDNSMDSRAIGLINKRNYIGKVINAN